MAEWTRETPWRQGHLLTEDAIEKLHLGKSSNTLVVVATHDCDLAQDAIAEPYVEVIIGSSINFEAMDGNYTHGKSARKLHIEYGENSPLFVELEVTGKASVAKQKLAEFTPRTDHKLSSQALAAFQMWLAQRYRRSAFPDEFERRLKVSKLAEKIARPLKPLGGNIIGVFFDVDDGDEVTRKEPEDTYVLDILILHAAEPDFVQAEKEAAAAARTIETSFKEKLFNPAQKWLQIELRSCEIVSESVLTYMQFRQLKRWRLDYISFASDQPVPVE